jgi:hypothetical protein
MSQSKRMARLTEELSQAAAQRKSSLDAMREATKATLKTCARMRGETAHEYRARMQDLLASLAKEAANHRKMVAQQIMQTRKYLGAQAQGVATHRNATMSQMRLFARSRRDAAAQLRDSLKQQVNAIVMQTTALCNAAATAVNELANSQQAAAQQHRAALRSDRRKMHAGVARFIDAMHADRMKAHAEWSAHSHGEAV